MPTQTKCIKSKSGDQLVITMKSSRLGLSIMPCTFYVEHNHIPVITLMTYFKIFMPSGVASTWLSKYS